MAISNGLNDGDVPNGGLSGGAVQQMLGIGSERQDTGTSDGMATLPSEHRHHSIGRREDVRRIAEMPAPKSVYGTGSEIWFPPTQIKKMLGDHLRSATRPCRICYHEVLNDAPNPGLSIKGLGPISFPFLERDIGRIIEASKRLGVEEAEDVSAARATWEVPSDMLELRNPSWGRLLTSLLSTIGSELEIGKTGRGILASKPTLILYEPNSVVDPIKCLFSKSPVFGFLDITLPSKYTGGELRVEHDGRKEAISVCESSEFDCSCLAWFSNVVSTSAPVSSGHRLVLRYTLEHNLPGPVCRAVPLAQEILQLRSILTSWTKQNEKVEHGVLAYVLRDKYEDKQLGQIELSSSDQLAVAQLTEACAEAGFFLCFSNLSARIVARKKIDSDRRIWQPAEHPSCSFQLGRIVDLHGKELLGNYHMDIEEDDIVQEQAFNDNSYIIDEDSVSSDSYDHCVIKLFHKTVVIIMPLEARVPFFYGVAAPDYNARVKELLVHFCSSSSSTVGHAIMTGEVRSVCEAVLSAVSWDPDSVHYFASGYATEVHSYVLKSIHLLGDKDLLVRACPIGFATLDNFKVLDGATKVFEDNWLQSSLHQQMAVMSDFLSRCIAIEKIAKFLPDMSWVNDQYEAAMEILKFTADRDVEGVIKIATFWEKDSRLQSILIPTMQRNLKGNDRILALLSQLSVEKQIPDCVFKEVMPQSVEHFIVEKAESQRAYVHQLMSNILLHCHTLELTSILLQAVSRISFAATKATPNELENEYLSFLSKLAGTIDKTKCMTLPLFQGLFQHIVNLIALKCVPIKKNWILRPCGCGCPDCNTLDAFLVDNSKEAAEFKRETERRDHLQQRLRMAHPTSARTSTNVGAGFPFALRVIKMGGPIDNPVHYWTRKHEILSSNIASIGSKRLRRLLGQHYTNLILLKPIYFSPVINDVDPEVVNLTAAENRASPSVQLLSSHKPNDTSIGSRSVSAPIPPTARSHLTPLQNILSTPNPSPVTWSAINHRTPSQTIANSTLSTPAENLSNSHQTLGQSTLGVRHTHSPATDSQSLVGSAHLDQLPLQKAANWPTAQKVASGPSSSHITVKTESPTLISRQGSSFEHPIGLRTPNTISPVLTSSSRTLSPLSQAGSQQNSSLSISKRKAPPNSVEKENKKDSQLKKAKRARVGDPNSMSAPNPIPGGVWGSVDAPFPPLPDDYVTPPPPAWLVSSLAALEPNFPGHQFHAIMLHCPVSIYTNMPCPEPATGQPIPADVKYMWIPRIQCDDCPAKLYIPGSQRSVTNFVFHLKNQTHNSNVEKRLLQNAST